MSKIGDVIIVVAAAAVIVGVVIYASEHITCFNWWPFAKGCVVSK